MNLTTTTVLAGLGVAAAVGWSLGGADGTGVLAGFLAGASVAGGCVLLQRKVALSAPQYLVQSVLAGFLIKAVAMLATTLALALVPALRDACAPLAYLIAFAASSIGILVPATLDTLRLLEHRRSAAEPRGTPRVSEGLR